MDTAVRQQMVFTNKQEMIYPFLKDVVAFIKRNLPGRAAQVVFKAKMVVSELLTNSIKHANDEFTLIELIVTNDIFIIKRVDNGKPFNLKDKDTEDDILRWPLTANAANVIKIHTDHLNGLFAQIISPYSLSFHAKSYTDEAIVFPDISEHYGLMIICRASDSFIYELDPTSLKNTFTVTIQLH